MFQSRTRCVRSKLSSPHRAAYFTRLTNATYGTPWCELNARSTVLIGNLGMFASFDKADVNDITDEWLAWIAMAARSLPMSTVLRALSSHQGVQYVVLVNRVKSWCARL